MSGEQYRLQVESFAKTFGCELRHVTTPPMMFVEFGYVEVPEIRSQIDYMANLHELGHFFYRHTQGRPPKDEEKFYFTNGVLRSEAEAWNWAMNWCVDELQADTRLVMEASLRTYFDAYVRTDGKPTRIMDMGNRHYVVFVYDRPDTYFMDTVYRMRGNNDRPKGDARRAGLPLPRLDPGQLSGAADGEGRDR